jgi:hypothetical protein
MMEMAALCGIRIMPPHLLIHHSGGVIIGDVQEVGKSFGRFSLAGVVDLILSMCVAGSVWCRCVVEWITFMCVLVLCL